MPRDRVPSSAAWLAEARIDLLWIEKTAPHEALYRRIAYIAQQAAEKALKAVLAHHDEVPGKTHHIGNLIERAAGHAKVPEHLLAAYTLTAYVSATRYPDDYYELTEPEASEAVDLARAVVDWAAGIIEDA